MTVAMDEETEAKLMGLYQEVGQLKSLVETMTIKRGDLNSAALEVAREVDSIFVQAHNSPSQRTSRVQIVVRSAMQQLLGGEKQWDWWNIGKPKS